MKRLILTLMLLAGMCSPVIYAGKWDTIGRAVYMAGNHPEETLSIGAFLIALFLMCIPSAIVGGVVSIILKSVFELDKEETQKAFLIVGGILLAIFLLMYFLV